MSSSLHTFRRAEEDRLGLAGGHLQGGKWILRHADTARPHTAFTLVDLNSNNYDIEYSGKLPNGNYGSTLRIVTRRSNWHPNLTLNYPSTRHRHDRDERRVRCAVGETSSSLVASIKRGSSKHQQVDMYNGIIYPHIETSRESGDPSPIGARTGSIACSPQTPSCDAPVLSRFFR
ncbi:hypothetical protein BGW36DRAFT_217002 [Talaromyces proteolyticus]|uniref:Uncharacterized protein n=1 Tax=Talaromyces proteolyticus TaxID=1131652 RepID=A0AAD4PYC8_9EURO|nr:uncharacterized protein BGW36DRAFT_217002 [Talaromyces proteolyticus]KAH8694134.1 hypothetical protein BGW36DRAFT_217002 [Talaromyces proteolyticus]